MKIIEIFPKLLLVYAVTFAGLITCGDLADYLEPRFNITGKDGKDGKDGDAGIDGQNGQDGDRGDPGDIGVPGSDGASGAVGSRGDQGLEGEQGQPGSILTTHALAYCVMADNGVYVHKVSSSKFSVYGNDTCTGASYCFEIKEHRLCWPTVDLQISLDNGIVYVVKYN